MKTFRVKAIQTYYWAGKDNPPGSIFEVDDREIESFRFIQNHIPGVLEIVPDELAPTQQTPVATAAPAETALRPPAPIAAPSNEPIESMTTTNADPIVPPPRRKYIRRNR